MSHGKVALITGSGKRRIGNVVALALAERGYDIAIHYNRSEADSRQSVAELQAKGVQAAAFQADVANEDDVARLFDETMKTFGRLDVLVTAAAVWQRKPLEETTAADVRRQFDINTLGTFLCCQRAGRIMAKQPEGGAIVTIGDWAVERPYPSYAAYFASKGARYYAHAHVCRRTGRCKIPLFVSIASMPGPVMVPDNLSEHEVKGVVAGTLLKRLGRPENISPRSGLSGRKRLRYRHLPAGRRRTKIGKCRRRQPCSR